jgi:hypothetical protein
LNCTYKIVGLDESKLKSLSLEVVQDAECDVATGTQLKYSACWQKKKSIKTIGLEQGIFCYKRLNSKISIQFKISLNKDPMS